MSRIEDLEKLQHLKESGILTDEEFEKEKRIILNDASSNNAKIEHKKVKQKIKPWQIVVMIILVILARIYNIWAYSWI